MHVLAIVQWVHVAAGATFAGAHLVSALIVWPALRGMPAEEAQRVQRALSVRMRRVVGPAALLTLALGVARGTWWGPIGTVSDVVGTAYGRWWALALVGTVALQVWGMVSGAWLARRAFVGERWAPGGGRAIAASASASVGLVAVILGAMVAMRLGVAW